MSISNLNIFLNYGMMGKSGMGLVAEKCFKMGLVVLAQRPLVPQAEVFLIKKRTKAH